MTGAYAAETTAVAPEDPDGSYALLEDEEGFGATVEWVGDADPYGIALLAAGDDHDLKTWITDVNYEKTTDGKTWTSIGAGSVTVDSGTHVRVNLKYTVKPGCADAHQQYPDLPAAQRPAHAGCGDGQHRG